MYHVSICSNDYEDIESWQYSLHGFEVYFHVYLDVF